ncbi:MAG TPA: hypothetical protein VFG29_05030 [Syntrophales bacterium]|nr:hypothetical protein [Syntrophales bacterium]
MLGCFFLIRSNRDITYALALRELALRELVLQELALRELVLQELALVPVPEPLLLSLQALAVSFLVQTDSQPKRTRMLLTSAPKE